MATEDDDDWTSGIPIALPLPALKQQAHDLFDPIWRDDRTVTRGWRGRWGYRSRRRTSR